VEWLLCSRRSWVGPAVQNSYMLQNYRSGLIVSELAVPLNLRQLLKMECKVNSNILLGKRFFDTSPKNNVFTKLFIFLKFARSNMSNLWLLLYSSCSLFLDT